MNLNKVFIKHQGWVVKSKTCTADCDDKHLKKNRKKRKREKKTGKEIKSRENVKE